MKILTFLAVQLVFAPLLVMAAIAVVSPRSTNTFLRALALCAALVVAQVGALLLVPVSPLLALAAVLASPFVLTRMLYAMGIFRTLLLGLVLAAEMWIVGRVVGVPAPGPRDDPPAERI